MKADYHMHTSFSADSTYPMEDEVLRAIELGLDEICFTDHVDHVPSYEDSDLVEYRKEYLRMKDKYSDKLTIKFGVEFGMQLHTTSLFEKDFNDYDFDFVIMSCHQIDDKGFWNQEYQEGMNQNEINVSYYEYIYECAKRYKNYSVLGHLDAIKRDDPYGEYDDKYVLEIIEKILKLVIEDGKGIEVNTSNFRYGLSDLTPSRNILKLYYDLGGRILTFGSDSHKEEHVSYKIDEVKKIVKEIGFTHFCTFEKMKPIYHEL